jgi:hypothetical protein
VISTQGYEYPERAWNEFVAQQRAGAFTAAVVHAALAEVQANQVDSRDQGDAEITDEMTRRIVQLAPAIGQVEATGAADGGASVPAAPSTFMKLIWIVLVAVAIYAFVKRP